MQCNSSIHLVNLPYLCYLNSFRKKTTTAANLSFQKTCHKTEFKWIRKLITYYLEGPKQRHSHYYFVRYQLLPWQHLQQSKFVRMKTFIIENFQASISLYQNLLAQKHWKRKKRMGGMRLRSRLELFSFKHVILIFIFGNVKRWNKSRCSRASKSS